jgi:SAM-dependent methyltransferase
MLSDMIEPEGSAYAEYLAANHALWNEWTAINAASRFYDVDRFRQGGIRLRDYELEEMGEVRGKDVLHLQCHFGLDTLSFVRLGARATGVDFSEAGIDEARRLAGETGLEATFVHSTLDGLPSRLPGREFDIVYASRGVLGWLPDLSVWARTAAHFVKPGGFFYVTEAHPFLMVFDDGDGVRDLRVKYPYWFRPQPLVFETQGSYADRTAPMTQPMEFSWPHSMGEIVTVLAEAGLRIDFLHEFPFMEWPVSFLDGPDDQGKYRLQPDVEGEVPLFFSLKASKPLPIER